MDRLKAYSKEIISLVEAGKIKSKAKLNEEKIGLCKKHGIKDMPSDPTILSYARKRTPRLVSLLKVKPTRSLSGIAVVAIMPKPSKCPGDCVYCPGSLLPTQKTPKSYTGTEPATMRAISSGYSAKKQVANRVQQLQEAGHSTAKVELIVMGGTFPASPLGYQKKFMLESINALSGSKEKSLPAARKAAEKSRRRITGITFETRPDFCGEKEISRMLSFGGTRCELGVQTVYNRVYKKINRGHTVEDVAKATRLLKDSAFKVTYHYMPGLPTVSLSEDKRALKEIFQNPDFRPDGLKIYPCLVIKGTGLYRQWKKGKYEPFSTAKAVRLLSASKQLAPRWLRIMRIQRDIPAGLISAGVKKSNLRQIVQREMHETGKKCNCIRCREAGLQQKSLDLQKARLFSEEYQASEGKEMFISLEDGKRKCLFGFARLRLPSKPFRKEISGETALLRELRVFGMPLPLHERSEHGFQHKGLGKRLLQEAEEKAREFSSKKLLVISGLGTKQYYCGLGFEKDGLFVSKKL